MRQILLALALFGLAACAGAPQPSREPKFEPMVVAANPLAVEAGVEMLRRGGSATDAAIASMLVLGLVEPQSAGLGGGGFLLHYTKAGSLIEAYDGRERAPAAAGPELFLDAQGQPLAYPQAMASGRSVGVPAVIPMLELAHKEHGRLPWRELFGPALKLADEGFAVSPRLHALIAHAGQEGALKANPTTRAYFFTAEGAPLPVGFILKNPDYARTLRAVRSQGAKALQDGPIAEAIVAGAHEEPLPGLLTLADLRAYQPRKLAPICGTFRVYEVCSMPPPSSGGVAVIEALGLYERAQPRSAGRGSEADWHDLLWALRIAYADRDHYVADEDYAPGPTRQLIDPRYLDKRARLIGDAAPPALLAAGDPSQVLGGKSYFQQWGREKGVEAPGTTHLTIVDAEGNAVALTATVESPFGSKRMAAGFILNNQLTDFSLAPTKNGLPVANAPAGGKRPRSSMAPTILLDRNGNLYASVGSPGGGAIIAYVAKTIVAMVDWGLAPQQAVSVENLVAAGPQVRAEADRTPAPLLEALTRRGWNLAPATQEASGLHVIRIVNGRSEGGADPRREGRVGRP
jgi:gamma-glutamyltranspeptidase/glutathione hydrolase